MNVFILDRDMQVSAAMLDDAHLLAQINEATQILMANYDSIMEAIDEWNSVNDSEVLNDG